MPEMCRSRYKIKTLNEWIESTIKMLKICIRIDWKKDSFVVRLINDNFAEPSIHLGKDWRMRSHPDISKWGNKARVKQL